MEGILGVVIVQLGDQELALIDFVNHAMFFVDAARPVAGKVVFEGLGFSDAFEGVALSVFDESRDAFGHAAVLVDPVAKVFPCLV